MRKVPTKVSSGLFEINQRPAYRPKRAMRRNAQRRKAHMRERTKQGWVTVGQVNTMSPHFKSLITYAIENSDTVILGFVRAGEVRVGNPFSKRELERCWDKFALNYNLTVELLRPDDDHLAWFKLRFC